MKRQFIYCCLSLLMIVSISKAQLININPDPYGDLWIVGDVIPPPIGTEPTASNMILTPKSEATELPSVIDNSQFNYMPPVFNQFGSAACVQVAEVWYTFGYEINRQRNVPAGDGINDLTNLYHPFFSYNFLNNGSGGEETYKESGFNIIIENGCPSFDIYDDEALNGDDKYIYWMDGSENYRYGMNNKAKSIENINWNQDYSSLDLLKHWLSDHNAGEETGV